MSKRSGAGLSRAGEIGQKGQAGGEGYGVAGGGDERVRAASVL